MKGLIGTTQQVFHWFVYQILIKRVSQSTVQNIYIDLLKGLGIKDCITQTIALSFEIFRKCLSIEEEKLNQVTQSAPG